MTVGREATCVVLEAVAFFEAAEGVGPTMSVNFTEVDVVVVVVVLV